ncbi:protein kinase [Nannochloropsis gaditana]|uniref:Protein kinase n=1 Tax=Nannochloropsis gaditana TaxID=72520 RepID=W7T9V3_9STRA|nr:protein kinase [Nannochloropsis gaditana]
MGNELTKKYDKEKIHTASGGHECLWKIYRATVKSTGEPASVFVLDLDDLKSLPKNEREQLLDIFRKDIRALRELNHPYILKIYDVLEENKKCLAFVAERVSFSLANALHRYQNLPAREQPLPKELVEFR